MIGITLDNNTSMFCDGMRKHCFTFYQQMEYMNMEPVFLCTDIVAQWLKKDYSNIRFVKYSAFNNVNSISLFNAIIEWEVFLPSNISLLCQQNKIKVIRMNCGNIYHSSHIHFLENKSTIYTIPSYLNELWSLPHYNNSISIKNHLYKRPAKTIPYIFGFTK